MPAQPDINMPAKFTFLLEIPELLEIVVDSKGTLIGININIDNVEKDLVLADFESLPLQYQFDNKGDLDSAVKEVLKQWRAN